MEDFRETCVTRIQGDNHIGIYTSERKYINQIMKLKEEYPNDVVINKINLDGSICVDMPYDWFRMPKAKRKISSEQKEKLKENMKKAREARKENDNADDC